jgi:predicted DNA-binding transcriptional regulator AlpA
MSLLPTSVTDDENLTLPEAARWLRTSTRNLQRLLEDGDGPPVVRLSQRRILFRRSDLREWLDRRVSGRRGPEAA